MLQVRGRTPEEARRNLEELMAHVVVEIETPPEGAP